jgi:hypothetical protein
VGRTEDEEEGEVLVVGLVDRLLLIDESRVSLSHLLPLSIVEPLLLLSSLIARTHTTRQLIRRTHTHTHTHTHDKTHRRAREG